MKPKKKPTKKKAPKQRHSLVQYPDPFPRKTIQLVYVPPTDSAMGDVPQLYALCDDGSIWCQEVGADDWADSPSPPKFGGEV